MDKDMDIDIGIDISKVRKIYLHVPDVFFKGMLFVFRYGPMLGLWVYYMYFGGSVPAGS